MGGMNTWAGEHGQQNTHQHSSTEKGGNTQADRAGRDMEAPKDTHTEAYTRSAHQGSSAWIEGALPDVPQGLGHQQGDTR